MERQTSSTPSMNSCSGDAGEVKFIWKRVHNRWRSGASLTNEIVQKAMTERFSSVPWDPNMLDDDKLPTVKNFPLYHLPDGDVKALEGLEAGFIYFYPAPYRHVLNH